MAALLGAGVSSSACGDSESLAPLAEGGGGSSTASNTGGQGPASSSSQTSTSTTAHGSSSATATTGSGGATVTGTGGAGGATTTGAGGAGGGSGNCLDPSTYDDLFTITDPTICAIAVREVDAAYDFELSAVSWGTNHGGPLLVAPGVNQGDADLQRLHIADATTLTLETQTVQAGIPAGAFLGAQALDLGFFGWTAIGWSGAFPATQGQIILVDGTAVATTYAVNAPFAFGAIADDANTGRLIYSGASKLDDATTDVNAVYAADSCGMGASAALEPGTTAGCGAPLEVAAWDDASGPMAVDLAGNVFAVMTNFSGDQQARGFARSDIQRGAPASMGAIFFTISGFGSALAAMAPSGTDPGVLAFQPSDGTTFLPLDVLEVTYTAALVPDTPHTLLTLTSPGTALGMTSDDQGQIWVAGPRGAKTAFVVLARKSP
jgi:hypothetical protein